ncbi:MAG: DUF4249 family protein [Bacteroidales bacterium]
MRPSKLVVNSYFSADSIWEIQVSKSLSVLDNANLQKVNNASIDIYKNSELIDSSFYYSYHQTNLGDEYYTAVYGSVEGTFNITFSDPVAIENYYMLSLFTYDKYYNFEDSTIAFRERRNISFTTNDPVAGDDDSYRSSLLFSDDFFNGQNYQLKITIMDWDATLDKEYEIELLSMNKAGYLYRRSVEDYQNSKHDPFSEPVRIYSNIENGFGIFAGYAVDSYPFQLFTE